MFGILVKALVSTERVLLTTFLRVQQKNLYTPIYLIKETNWTNVFMVVAQQQVSRQARQSS